MANPTSQIWQNWPGRRGSAPEPTGGKGWGPGACHGRLATDQVDIASVFNADIIYLVMSSSNPGDKTPWLEETPCILCILIGVKIRFLIFASILSSQGVLGPCGETLVIHRHNRPDQRTQEGIHTGFKSRGRKMKKQFKKWNYGFGDDFFEKIHAMIGFCFRWKAQLLDF